ncbi:uncharacterized protein [Physcomitrium patens]|uniref:uncharacterized protein isoform X1 n=1 Tax=Physcomitrium patens TaxID=3218 RepID=UPI003CCDA4B3
MRIYKPGTRTGGRCCTRTLFVTNCVVIVCNTLSVVYYVYESVVNPALQQHEPSTPQLFPKKIGSSLLSLGSVSPLSSQTSKIRFYIQGTSLRGSEVRRFWSDQNCFRLGATIQTLSQSLVF